MTMELRHIRYFLAVADERHFTRAAAKLGIGQPPLSLQIKDLENEVGAALFRRLPHGAELTPAGEAFFDVVKEMPVLTERATRAAKRAARGETGSLRLGFTASAAFNTVVPSAIRAFRRAYPDIDLHLEEANTTRLVAGIKESLLDVVFLRPEAAGTEELRLRVVSEEPMMVALPTNHPAAKRKAVDLSALESDAFLLFPRQSGPTLYDTVITACRNAGFEPRLGQSAPQISSVVNLVAAELGVTLVPASMSQLSVAGVTYRAIAGDAPTTRLALACRRGETSPVIRNFLTAAVS
jgi:DNA-binding transcriptional LysR family regulator